MKKTSVVLVLGLMACSIGFSQQALTLEMVLQQAQEKSIQSLLTKNEFLEAYWNYKMYRAEQLPFLYLNMTPIAYDKSFSQIYNVVDDKDEFREMYKVESAAGLYLAQNIGLTGGTVSLSSSLYRVQNLFIGNDINYSSVPFMINYNQPLFAHNEFKWDKIIEPKRYKMAKSELMQDLQDLNVEAVSVFFNVITAQNNVFMAEAEVAATDTLLRIGRTRQGIADIDREDLLNLELNHSNARVKLLQYREELRKAKDQFRLFIGLGNRESFTLLLPNAPPDVELTPDDALTLARMYNPDIFNLEIDRLEAQKSSDKAVKEYRFNINMDLSYGLNQSGTNIPRAYSNPLDRQLAIVSMQVPILDWGRKKQAVSLAKSREKIVDAQSNLELQNIEQEIMNLAYQYALKELETANTAIADSIANISYGLVLERFRTGDAGITELDNSQAKKDAARQQYLTTQEKFWALFYQLQSATLFDLRIKKELDVDVESYVE
jgi:Outer membrane efflux protein